jgi:Zn-dependent protease with chaperone function
MVKKFGLIIAFAVSLSGCASVETRLPQPDIRLLAKESSAQEQAAFIRYLDMMERLDRISAQVLHANADLCEKTVPDIGVRTHSKKSYPKHLRAAAAKHMGAGDKPSVVLVRQDSAAARAGLRFGDVLLDDDNSPTAFLDKKNKERIEQTGEIRKRTNNTVGYEILTPQASSVCGYPVKLKFSTAINAYANGKSITVTTGMMEFAEQDEELALVVGHELAHNTMRHVPKSIRNLLLSGFATRTTRPFESEADYVGMYYLARAGFELEGVENFWRRLGVISPKSIVRAKTHPVSPARLLSIRATANEIEQKKLSGTALMPNYLKDRKDKNGL